MKTGERGDIVDTYMCVTLIGSFRHQAIDVLVVDDDRAVGDELAGFLCRANLTCKSAVDGWSALRLLADGCRPTVIVTDLRMPELDGAEFVERLIQLSGTDRPEIIFASGAASFDDAVAAIRLGARDMLAKPIKGQVLVRAVKSAQIAAQHRRSANLAALAASEVKPASEKPADPVERRRSILKELRAVRGIRSKYFPPDLFSDPCWEMLLDLYEARLGGSDVSVTTLGATSGVPMTTALRRIEALQAHDLIVRLEDEDDQRRINVRLTGSGVEAVEKFFGAYLAVRGT